METDFKEMPGRADLGRHVLADLNFDGFRGLRRKSIAEFHPPVKGEVTPAFESE